MFVVGRSQGGGGGRKTRHFSPSPFPPPAHGKRGGRKRRPPSPSPPPPPFLVRKGKGERGKWLSLHGGLEKIEGKIGEKLTPLICVSLKGKGKRGSSPPYQTHSSNAGRKGDEVSKHPPFLSSKRGMGKERGAPIGSTKGP